MPPIIHLTVHFDVALISYDVPNAPITRRKNIKNDKNLISEYVNWIDNNLQPDVFVVATLKQSIIQNNGKIQVRNYGDVDKYQAAYSSFICNLSKSIYGLTNWRRCKNRVPNFGSIEGNGCGRHSSQSQKNKSIQFVRTTQSVGKDVRYHLNMNFRRPPHVTFEHFKGAILDCWLPNPWAMPDIYIEERTGDSVAYSLKEGSETVLVDPLSF